MEKFDHRIILELAQEPQVVFVEQPYVINRILEHGDPLDPHAERETGIHAGGIPGELEDPRIDHPRAQYLKPPRVLANPAPFS